MNIVFIAKPPFLIVYSASLPALLPYCVTLREFPLHASFSVVLHWKERLIIKTISPPNIYKIRKRFRNCCCESSLCDVSPRLTERSAVHLRSGLSACLLAHHNSTQKGIASGNGQVVKQQQIICLFFKTAGFWLEMTQKNKQNKKKTTKSETEIFWFFFLLSCATVEGKWQNKFQIKKSGEYSSIL